MKLQRDALPLHFEGFQLRRRLVVAGWPLAVAVAGAEVLGAEAVFIGANILDNPGYPDCRPVYFEAFNRVIALGTRPETHIDIKTPIIHLDKAGIVRMGLELGVPFGLTWSCYVNDEVACGRCSSCVLRLKGFAAAGVADPIPYQTAPAD